jgi:hypothetical protein
MWRLLFVGFLIAHGLVHLAVWAMPKPKDQRAPFDPATSWLFGRDQRTLALTLAFGAAAVLVAAGLGLWVHADWWRPVAVTGLAISFLLMVVYFNPWFLFIEGVNAGLIAGILWFAWPSQTMVGA